MPSRGFGSNSPSLVLLEFPTNLLPSYKLIYVSRVAPGALAIKPEAKPHIFPRDGIYPDLRDDLLSVMRQTQALSTEVNNRWLP